MMQASTIAARDKLEWLLSASNLNTDLHELALVSVANYVEHCDRVFRPNATFADRDRWAKRLEYDRSPSRRRRNKLLPSRAAGGASSSHAPH
jgi:hypothetical protein